jgi:hypothetical protein
LVRILSGSGTAVYVQYCLIVCSITEAGSCTSREERRLRIFGHKREEVTGDCRKLHNGKLHHLYSSPNIIRVIKSRTMKWVGLLVCMGKKRNAYLRERDHFEDLGVDGRIVLELNFKEVRWGPWTGLVCLRIGRSCWLL